ncbi:MAG: hypothetical protein KC502_11460 [Myxococcales bacterium]|nr:hypothetical protein [Myxococcales bacterium]
MVPDLLGQLAAPVQRFSADRAYDDRPVHTRVLAAGPAAKIVISPIRTAKVAGPSEPTLTQRDAAIESIAQDGRRQWKKTAGSHPSARAENCFSGFKRIIGRKLRARCAEAQNIAAKVAAGVPDRMSAPGRPESVATPAA